MFWCLLQTTLIELDSLLRNDPYVVGVPVQFVEIKTIPYNKMIWYGESNILCAAFLRLSDSFCKQGTNLD